MLVYQNVVFSIELEGSEFRAPEYQTICLIPFLFSLFTNGTSRYTHDYKNGVCFRRKRSPEEILLHTDRGAEIHFPPPDPFPPKR